MTPDVTSDMDNTSYHALLAEINSDPSSYKEAMQTREKYKWQEAISEELLSMKENEVWVLVDRPKPTSAKSKLNVINSRWVLKRKYKDGGTKYKARLVIRGFKDLTQYDLTETYAPVSRLSLVRAVLAIINKYDLEVVQLDVKTAFLNGKLDEHIYMEIPEGFTEYNESERRTKVCKLQRALYGLRISPKRWNMQFSEVAEKAGLKSHDTEPCLFTWREGEEFLILLLYVDDMLIASNKSRKLQEVKTVVRNEFIMSDLGAPETFLGIEIKRTREK